MDFANVVLMFCSGRCRGPKHGRVPHLEVTSHEVGIKYKVIINSED